MTVFGLHAEQLGLFAFAVLLLALTPGPVWIYLISRTLTQGRRAGYFSLIGVMAGVLVHLLAAALGLSALLLALPAAFDAIKLAGAAYLLWLAWNTLRGAGFSFTPQPLDPVPDRVLFRQSLTASVINPKVAVFYLSLFPQFVDPAAGSVLLQSLALGIVHVSVSTLVDGSLVTVAGGLSAWLARRPHWLRVQRWVLGGAFGVLAVWLALTSRQH
ncbi:MAG TPA: LysE family translocator [Burkholderiaceae bacterium]|nr:LysE family translocator [Burkholderiaceae bacterium]HQR69696.1 LysE family translocator [Burkholderiaceae bacterium]